MSNNEPFQSEMTDASYTEPEILPYLVRFCWGFLFPVGSLVVCSAATIILLYEPVNNSLKQTAQNMGGPLSIIFLGFATAAFVLFIVLPATIVSLASTCIQWKRRLTAFAGGVFALLLSIAIGFCLAILFSINLVS